jgi:dTDP-4-amino-4,6-dideoxygalactose transaminase
MTDSRAAFERITLPSDQDASGRTLGQEEVEALTGAIRSGTLTSTKGDFVKSFEAAFARKLGVKHAYACASGTAAVHLAVAALDPEPGHEIVTSPITDMGALTPILYQGAIPVFADVDAGTCNVTAETIAARLSPKTKAIVVTHLFGNPCDMDPILELASSRGVPVIEDCAQSFGASYKGRKTGSMGVIGTFSLQQGKHITTGEGGIVATNDDALARRMYLAINKAWGYGDPKPDHYFVAPNYRMTELAGAVALAQIGKLDAMIAQRVAMAKLMDEKLAGVRGVEAPKVTPGGKHTYWKYALWVDPKVIKGGADALGGKLKEAGVFCVPRYIQKPAFECEVLRDKRSFGNSKFPWEGAHRAGDPPVVYDAKDTPGTVEALSRVVVLPWNEKYRPEHVDAIAGVVRAAAAELAG